MRKINIPYEAKSNSNGKNFLSGGAIQFKIDNLLQISSFRGSTVSLQSSRRKNSAYRIGITIEGSAEELEYQSSNKYYSANDSLLSSSYSDNDSPGKKQGYLRASVEILSFYSHPSTINIYSGTGFFVGLGQTTATSEDNNNSFINNTVQEVTTLTGGINGFLGAELYVVPRISLHGEYNVGLSLNKINSKIQYYSEAIDTGNYTQQTIEGTGVTYGVMSEVLFGVSIHLK